jgi:hypothetical protein
VAVGEVGLAGEIRRVPGVERRLAAAARMGFRRAIVPAGSFPVGAQLPDPDLAVVEVPDVATALTVALPARGIAAVPGPGIRRMSDVSARSSTKRRPLPNRLHSTAPPEEADASSAR